MGKNKSNRLEINTSAVTTSSGDKTNATRRSLPDFLTKDTVKELLNKLSGYKNSSRTTRAIQFENIEVAGHSGAQLRNAYKKLKSACLTKLPLRIELAIIEELYASALTIGLKKNKSPEELERPHRPLSSYFLFAARTREKLLKKKPGLSFQEINHKTATKWREMDPEKKKSYADEANRMLDEYKIRLEEYYKKYPDQKPKLVRKKKQSRAKPPMTGLALYVRENRARFIEQGVNRRKIDDAAYVEFQRLDKETRQEYERKSAEMYMQYKARLLDRKQGDDISSAFNTNFDKSPTKSSKSEGDKDNKDNAKIKKEPISKSHVETDSSDDEESSSSSSNTNVATKKPAPKVNDHHPAVQKTKSPRKQTSSDSGSDDDDDDTKKKPAPEPAAKHSAKSSSVTKATDQKAAAQQHVSTKQQQNQPAESGSEELLSSDESDSAKKKAPQTPTKAAPAPAGGHRQNDETSSDSDSAGAKDKASKQLPESTKKDAAFNSSKMLELVTGKSSLGSVAKRKKSSSSSSSSSSSNAKVTKVVTSAINPVAKPAGSPKKTSPLKFEKDSDSESSSDKGGNTQKINAFNYSKIVPPKFSAPMMSTPQPAIHRQKKKHKK